MRVSNSSLSLEGLQRLQHLYDSIQHKAPVAKQLLKSALECPQALPDEELQSVRAKHALTQPPSSTTSDTYKVVCRLREYFRSAVFRA
eukprot:4997277-Amphidinium_carterae.1